MFILVISSGCSCTSLDFIFDLSVSLLSSEHSYSSYVIFLSITRISSFTVAYRIFDRIVLMSTFGYYVMFSLVSVINFIIFYSPSQC